MRPIHGLASRRAPSRTASTGWARRPQALLRGLRLLHPATGAGRVGVPPPGVRRTGGSRTRSGRILILGLPTIGVLDNPAGTTASADRKRAITVTTPHQRAPPHPHTHRARRHSLQDQPSRPSAPEHPSRVDTCGVDPEPFRRSTPNAHRRSGRSNLARLDAIYVRGIQTVDIRSRAACVVPQAPDQSARPTDPHRQNHQSKAIPVDRRTTHRRPADAGEAVTPPAPQPPFRPAHQPSAE